MCIACPLATFGISMRPWFYLLRMYMCLSSSRTLMRSLGEAGEIEPETESFLLENEIDCGDFTPEALDCLPKNLPWTLPKVWPCRVWFHWDAYKPERAPQVFSRVVSIPGHSQTKFNGTEWVGVIYRVSCRYMQTSCIQTSLTWNLNAGNGQLGNALKC